jgi:hypothetical protein
MVLIVGTGSFYNNVLGFDYVTASSKNFDFVHGRCESDGGGASPMGPEPVSQ